MAVSHVKNVTIAAFTGTVTVFNSAGATTTANATDLVLPTDWVSAHNQFMTISGNTAGFSSMSGTNIVFAGGPGVTLSAGTAAGAATISMSVAPQSTAPGAIAAGTQTATSGTIVFSNSNNITFGMSNSSVITASASYSQSTGVSLHQVLSPLADEFLSMDTNQLKFQWSNAVSFSTNATRQGMFEIDVPGNARNAADIIHIHQSNNALPVIDAVHVQAEGTAVTGYRAMVSASVAAEFNQPIQFTTNSLGATDASNFAIGSVPLIMGTQMSNSVANLNANYVQGVQSSQIVQPGFTSTTTAGTAVKGTLSTNGLSMAFPTFITNALTSQSTAPGAIAAGTQTATSGTIVFSNSNNLSFTMNGSTQIVGSASFPAQTAFVFSNSNNVSFGTNASTVTASASFPAQTVQPVAVSGSNGSFVFSTLTMGALNGLSFYTSNGSIVGSYTVPAAGGGIDVSLSGNTSGALALVSSGTLILAGGNNITLSQNGQSITISGPNAGGAQTGISGIVVSNTTYTSGTVSFSNANGISFGSSAGQAITASYTVPTQTVQPVAVSGSNGSFAFSTLTMGNLNGLSFYTSNGSVVGSYTVPTQTLQPDINQGISNVGNTLGNTGTASTGIQVFAASGGLTASQSTAAGQSTLWFSAPLAVGTATAQTNVTWTVNTGGISLNASGYAGTGTSFGGTNISGSMTHNSAGLTLSMSAAAPGGGGGPAISAAGNSVSNGTVVFSNNAQVSFGMAGSTITASVNAGAAAGVAAINNSNTTYTSGTIVLSEGGGAITIASGTGQHFNFSVPATSSLVGVGGISISTNGSTISISNNNFVGSWWQPEVIGGSSLVTQAQGTLYMRPFELDGAYDVDKYIFHQSLVSSASTMSISASVSAGSASSGTGTWGHTGTVLLFSRVDTNETGANYNSVQSFVSDTYSMSAGYSASVSWSTNASSASASWTTSGKIGWINNIDGAGGFTSSSSGTSGSSTFSSTSTNANSFSSSYQMSFPYAHFSGMRPIFVPGAGTNMPPGEYWMGMIQSTNTGSTNMPLQRVAYMSHAGLLYFNASTANSYLEIGNSANISSSNWRLGFGSYSSSGNTTTNIALTQITSLASNASMYFALDGKTK